MLQQVVAHLLEKLSVSLQKGGKQRRKNAKWHFLSQVLHLWFLVFNVILVGGYTIPQPAPAIFKKKNYQLTM